MSAHAQALPPGVTQEQMDAALLELSEVYGSSVVRADQARAICNEEQYMLECAKIGKKHGLFPKEEIKRVDSVLATLKGDTVEKMKACESVECLVGVATSLAKEISSTNPELAKALDLTPKKVEEKRVIVETAKEIGVDFEECRAMDPDTASLELLRGCARLAKNERIREYIPLEARDRTEKNEQTIELKEALAKGEVSCGNGTIDGCGTFCLSPSASAREEGVSAIPPICREIAERYFGAEGVAELERAYSSVRDHYDAVREYQRGDGDFPEMDPDRYRGEDERNDKYYRDSERFREEYREGDVIGEGDPGMDERYRDGRYRDDRYRDFATSSKRIMCPRVAYTPCPAGEYRQESRNEFGCFVAGECIPFNTKTQTDTDIDKRLICPAMPTVDSCPDGEDKVVAFTSPECGTYYSCQSKPKEKPEIKFPYKFESGRVTLSFEEARMYCYESGRGGATLRGDKEECMRTFGIDVPEIPRHKQCAQYGDGWTSVDESGNCFSPSMMEYVGANGVLRTCTEAPVYGCASISTKPPAGQKEQTWSKFGLRSWIREDASSSRIETLKQACANVYQNANVWTAGAGDPASSDFGMPDPDKCKKAALCGAADYFNGFECTTNSPRESCRSDQYWNGSTCVAREGVVTGSCSSELKSLLGEGCHSRGNAWFNSGLTMYVMPGTKTVKSCASDYIYGCAGGGAADKPQCADGKDNDADGMVDYPADSGCYGSDDWDEAYREMSGQGKMQVWNTYGLQSWIREDADTARIASLKEACANVKSYSANIWLPGAGSYSSQDFGMPDPGKCAKAATCASDQYFDGSTCVKGGGSGGGGGGGCGSYMSESSCKGASGCSWTASTGYYGGYCASTSTMWTPQCSDGKDNDGDGRIDYGSDSGCNDKMDDLEQDNVGGQSGMRHCFYNNATRNGQPMGYSVWCEADYYNCKEGSQSGASISLDGLSLGAPSQCESGWSGGGSSCSQGQYWNGSACVSTPPPSCDSGQYWNGSACAASPGGSCRSYYSQSSCQASSGCVWYENHYDGTHCDDTAHGSSGSSGGGGGSVVSCGSGYYWSGSTCTPTSASGKPQCSDGMDNDGDGKTDFPSDTGCYGSDDWDEAYASTTGGSGSSSCGSGYYWNGSSCMPNSSSGSACSSTEYWDSAAQSCKPMSSYDYSSAQAGCTSAGGTWNSSSNYCQMPSSSSSGSSCGSGYYWNGSSCVQSSSGSTGSSGTTDYSSMQSGCASAGGTWDSASNYCRMPTSRALSEKSFAFACPEGSLWSGRYCVEKGTLRGDGFVANVVSIFSSLFGAR